MGKKIGNDERVNLRKQLSAIVKGIDTDGLLFLIEQANIIKYNLEVDKANKMVAKKGDKSVNIIKSKTDDFVISAEKDKSAFIFILRGNRKFFTREEMRDIIKISLLNDPAKFYNYFAKERRDFITDCGIKSNKDPIISTIMNVLNSKYKLK